MTKVVKLTTSESRLAELKEVFGEPPVLPGSENIAAYEEMRHGAYAAGSRS